MGVPQMAPMNAPQQPAMVINLYLQCVSGYCLQKCNISCFCLGEPCWCCSTAASSSAWSSRKIQGRKQWIFCLKGCAIWMKTTLDKCCSVTPQRQIIKAENTVKSTADTQVRLRKINHKKFFKKLLTVCKNHILLEKLLFFSLIFSDSFFRSFCITNSSTLQQGYLSWHHYSNISFELNLQEILNIITIKVNYCDYS